MDVTFLKRDSKAVSAGIWIANVPGMGDTRFKVRGYSAPEVVAIRAAKERAVSLTDRYDDGTIKPDAQMRVFREVLAEGVLLDIENLTEGSKAVKVDTVRGWLLDPDYEPLADAVFFAANLADRKRKDQVEAVKGN